MHAGVRIAHYTILERIGAGGMGEVYKALDTHLGRYAALKLLAPDLTTDDELLRRLVREAQSASALSHPNIVTIYDTDRAVIDGTPTWYIAMEFIEGETLRDRLDHGRMDEITAASIIAQIADALAKAHRHGIVHRDIKPENIMITADGFAKVLDFGLAKLLEHDETADGKLTADGFVVGTISYMSPEQIRGQAIDGRSDVFALGCVLYEILSSRRAYSAETPVETMHRAIHSEPAHIQVAQELKRIIDRCLRKDREERYQSAKELATDLRRFVRYAETEGAPPHSIAVLPFRDLTSSGDENAHIGLALADAIVTELAGSRKLLVRPISATLPYRGIDPSTAGRALGVDSVVGGAFQRWGERLRVTVQLLSTEGGRSLFSTKIDSTIDDILALQDEMARRIAEALSIEIAPAQRPQAPSGVNEWFMKGKLALSTDTIQTMKEAIDAFTTVTTRNPDFAPAWAGLADAYARMAFSWDPNGDWYRRAVRASERALALEPDLAEAHYVRGRLIWSPQGQFDSKTALRHFAAALQMNPNLAEAHGRVGGLMYHVGAMEEAEAELRQTLVINPADAVTGIYLATCALYRGDASGCLKLIDETLKSASRAFAYYLKAHALLRLNRDEDASAAADLGALLFPEIAYYTPVRAVLAARAGNRARALEQIQRTIDHEKTYGHYHHAQYDIASAYAFLGDIDLAIQWLRDAAHNGLPCATLIERDPFLAAVRGPALDELIAEANAVCEEHRQLYASLIGGN